MYQGQNPIYEKSPKERKQISRNSNALRGINYEANTDLNYQKLNAHKREIDRKYKKYIKDSNIIDEDEDREACLL